MLTRIFFCSCLLLLSSISTQSIVIRHDRDDALYKALGARFMAVGQVAEGGEGVLIHPQWVLTAAHVAEGLGPFTRYVGFGGARYEVQKIILHPEWISRGGINSGRDMALLKLDRAVKGIEPVLLYTKDDEAGKVVTFVGRGLTGTGRTGPVRELGRELRAATNRVDEVDETSIRMVFDAPPAGTELEGISGPGDSGGPALLESGGKLYTLGVSSTNSGPGEGHCRYGTTETYARVSTSRGWVEGAIASDAPATPSTTLWSPVVKVEKGKGLPETQAGRVAAAYFSAFNSGLEAELLKFNAQHRPESFLKGRTPQQAARGSLELMEKLGRLELYGYSRRDVLALSVLTYSPRERSWQTFTFELETAAPHKLSVIAVSPAAAPQSSGTDAAIFRALDVYIQEKMREWEVPGLAIALVKDDRIVYARGFGVREVGKTQKVDQRTLFAIGSATKSFTAAAVATLVEAGKLKWDDPVVKYLPEFALYDPYVTREATIRDLLSHRTGLPRANLSLMLPYSPREVASRLRHLKPAAGFRARFGYQNQLYQILGLVIERVTGKSWAEYVREQFFTSLGMKATNTSIRALAGADNVAAPHAKIEGKVGIIAYRNHDNTGPAGAINSNVTDLAEWLRLQLGGGESITGKQALSKAMVREMQSPQILIPTGPLTERLFPTTHFQAYGMGWFLRDYRGRKVVEHGGNVDGMTAQIGMLPEERLGVVILSNMEGSPLPQILMYRVFDDFLGGASASDLNSEYLKLAREGERQQSEQQKKIESARVPDTKPSLSPDGYVGTYTNELYGEATVTMAEGKLMIRFNPEVVGEMEHWEKEVFRVKWADPFLAAYAGKTIISFTPGAAGAAPGFEAQNIGKWLRREAAQR